MPEIDDETLKEEIDEIMNRVETIMENVSRIIPDETSEGDGGES
jgi:hypothetical protein